MQNQISETKIAFITGGNRGIGFETAKQLGKLGIHPVLGCRNAENGKAAVAKLKEQGVEAEFLPFDVTRRETYQAAYEYFEKKFGRLDILVNNAGVYLEGEPGTKLVHTAENLPERILRDTLESNFFAVVAVTQTLLPLLKKAPSGRIVNLSSILGSLALHANSDSPIYKMKAFAYDTSKTALNSFTVQLAYALRKTEIKVNSAHPGWVQTEMGGSAAPMSITDGAKTSVLLATLPKDGMTGQFVHMGDKIPW